MPEFCQICARKWMRQLWDGQCVCTGHVKLGYQGLDLSAPRPDYPIKRRVLSLQEEKRVRKKK